MRWTLLQQVFLLTSEQTPETTVACARRLRDTSQRQLETESFIGLNSRSAG